METLHLLFWSLCIQHITESLVNIASNKEAWYCNRKPLDLHSISTLSNNDLFRINKLKQVHVMTRHGSRTHSENIQKYFPNNTQYYHCNISTITSRIEYNDENKNKYFVSMLKQYEYDNEYLLHSNCQRMQSYPSLIQQHQQNAQILINAYMNNKNNNNNNDPSQLFNIYELNKQSQAQENLKIYTSNKERCMLSTMILISTLLNISSSNNTLISPTITTITNDLDTNPYESPTVLCLENKQFNEWNNRYITDITDNFIKAKHDEILLQYKDVLNEYIQQGGKIINSSIYRYNDPGFHMTFYYCNGFDIPLRNDTFWRMVAASYQRFISIHPNKSSNDKNEKEYAIKKECYHHFLATPMYSRYFNDIYALIKNDTNYKKFILHSAHDSSIKWFLNGLGLHDGIVPYFAQMFTLEIYSANQNAKNKYNSDRNITYLFRWTNKGKFVEYEYCKHEYIATNGELCDLNILLNNGFKDVNITQRDWAATKCKTLLDDCVCGYCNDNDINNDEDDGKWIFEQISFIIGLLSGFILFALCLLIIRYAKGKLKSTQRSYQQALDASDIEMEDNTAITK